jgi:hypothetical protein
MEAGVVGFEPQPEAEVNMHAEWISWQGVCEEGGVVLI